MTPEQAAKLREPFKPEQIGKLPKPTKKENPKGYCDVCGGYHGLPAVHLDYVGHAATTDRLLQVDPEWSWKPMAAGPNGEPLMTNGGLWIELTVCGVTRPGFGDGQSTKEIIGDAIRNAAMRFGVALDLWAKEDLHADESGAAPESVDGAAPGNPAEDAYQAAVAAGRLDGALPSDQVIHFGKNKGVKLGALTPAQLRWYATEWKLQDDPSEYDHRIKRAAVALNAGHNNPNFDDEVPFE